MNKLIGLITAWGAEPFIEPALKQAIEYCDEVIVSVSANHPSFNMYADKTMDICQQYKDKIYMVKGISSLNHPNSKGSTLKKMLDVTGNNKKGNWIWILDADEFYFEEDVKKIKELIQQDDYSNIDLPEKFFLMNMEYYVKWHRTRLKQLPHDNVTFRTNQMGSETNKIFKLETNLGMHHYSFLMNPHFKKQFWKREYGDPNASFVMNKLKWMDKIYLKLTPENQKEMIEKSKKWFGVESILGCIFDADATDSGYLYKYSGKYPKYIQESKLYEIEDFRKIY